jgi:acyl carrier protein
LERDSVVLDIQNHLKVISDSFKDQVEEISLDDNLLEVGAIDSMAILTLVTWIEDKYGVQIEMDELTIENMGSISSMATFIINKKND